MRDLLKGYPQIRFGLYNGNTEYTEPEARSQYHRIYGMEPSPNEVISREKMQSNAAHLDYKLFHAGIYDAASE